MAMQEINEKREWNKAHTCEAVRIITEWLVSCKTREIGNLYPYQRSTLEWMLEEMGFDPHTVVWDIFCQEIRPMLELVGGKEEEIENSLCRPCYHLRWTVLDKVKEFQFSHYADSLHEYLEIEKCQRFLNGFRFLKENKEMRKAQKEFSIFKTRLRDSYKSGSGPCYSTISVGRQIALLRLPEYQIVGWFDYSFEGIKRMESVITERDPL